MREGFEPSIRLQTVYSLSRGAPSASRPPHRNGCYITLRVSECKLFFSKGINQLLTNEADRQPDRQRKKHSTIRRPLPFTMTASFIWIDCPKLQIKKMSGKLINRHSESVGLMLSSMHFMERVSRASQIFRWICANS